MTDLTPEQREQIDYLHAFNPDRGSRWIAAQLGDTVSYSTVLRYLAEQRHNGHTEIAITESDAIVLAAAEQPAVANAQSIAPVVEASTAAVAFAPVPPQPRQQIGSTDPREQLLADIRCIRDLVAEHEPLAAGALRDAFTGGDPSRPLAERFTSAFSRAQAGGLVLQSGGGVILTARGRFLLEQDQAAPQASPAPLDLATSCTRYLAAGDQALAIYQEQYRHREAAARERREWEALQLRGTLGHFFGALATFDAEWQWMAEPNLSLSNTLALRPRFPIPSVDADIYLHLLPVEGGLWLRPSTGGGRDVLLRPNQSAREIEGVLGLSLSFGIEAATVQGVRHA
jgi:hypothetical protein